MPLQAGQLVHNRYQIQGQLGQGGMGAVYLAHDNALEHKVAVKEMRPAPHLEPEALEGLREQFKREARVLAGLNHPNLPRVTDYFTDGDNAYLVMDYIEGQSLEDVLRAQGQPGLPEAQVTDWARQLLDALDYIHSRNVLHRDIKPANVRLSPDGRVVLVDFGLVKLYDPNSPQTMIVLRGAGTPQYAPPEQIDYSYGHTDARSDIFSLGATLYYLLTGKLPPSLTERLIKQTPIPPIRLHASNLSPATEAAILKAMQLRPDERFQSAREMRAALESAAPPGQPSLDEGASTFVLPASQPSATPTPSHKFAAKKDEKPVLPTAPPPISRPPSQAPPPPPVTPPPPVAPPQPRRIPVWGWLGGCGCLAAALVCGLLAAWGMLGGETPATPAAATATPGRVGLATNTPRSQADATQTPGLPGQVQFTNLEFASQITSDDNGFQTIDPGTSFSDISKIHAVWEYQGAQDGVDFRRVWIRDGEAVLDNAGPWDGGEKGTYHLSIYVESGVLEPGQYTLELYYDGELLASGEFEITESGLSDNVLYEDDFEDSSSGWSEYDEDNASVAYEGGRLVFNVRAKDWLAWANTNASLDLADVEINVEAAFESGPDGAELGVICRCSGNCGSEDNFYYFTVTNDGDARIVKVENGEQKLLISESTAAVEAGAASNYLTVECQGSALRMYVNGELAAEIEDTAFASGDVGLIAGTPETAGGLRGAFDNFVVVMPTP